MNRNILHLRVDGFPIAVERLRDSSLKGRPVVVCSRHSPRSLISSASTEARQEGVYEGMALTKALSRCRSLVVLPPDEGLYRKAAGEISGVLEMYSPLVESGHWGRFYVDMSGTQRLFGTMQDSAFRIRHGVRDSVGLISTLGIGSNKLVSGVAARVVESHGDLYEVPRGSEASFLAPFRVKFLPAVREKKDRNLLEEFNVHLVRQLAAFSVMQLTSVFGGRGVTLHRQALGIDERPVLPPASKPFILEEETLPEDTNDDAVLLAVLYGMMERSCRRMRAKGMMPRTVWLHLRHTDGVDVTRRLRLQTPVNIDGILFPQLESLYMKVSERRQRIRYLSLTFTDLILPCAQMALFPEPSSHPKAEALVTALDTIRRRFGETAIRWARVMGHG
jgi:DNA polymerase-4